MNRVIVVNLTREEVSALEHILHADFLKGTGIVVKDESLSAVEQIGLHGRILRNFMNVAEVILAAQAALGEAEPSVSLALNPTDFGYLSNLVESYAPLTPQMDPADVASNPEASLLMLKEIVIDAILPGLATTLMVEALTGKIHSLDNLITDASGIVVTGFKLIVDGEVAAEQLAAVKDNFTATLAAAVEDDGAPRVRREVEDTEGLIYPAHR